jgi:hypothetical protein
MGALLFGGESFFFSIICFKSQRGEAAAKLTHKNWDKRLRINDDFGVIAFTDCKNRATKKNQLIGYNNSIEVRVWLWL